MGSYAQFSDDDEDEVVMLSTYKDYYENGDIISKSPKQDSIISKSPKHNRIGSVTATCTASIASVTAFVPISPIIIPLNMDNSDDVKTPVTPVHDDAPFIALKVLKCLQKIDYHYPQKLCDWIHKLNTDLPKNRYQLNFVCIMNTHLIWNAKKIHLLNVDEFNLNNYDGFVSLLMAKEVKPHKTKYKFTIHSFNIASKKYDKTHTFKCDNQIDRDKWVNGLNKYINKLNVAVNEITNSQIDY